jgi:peptidyl-prolyl cis-trans isomerase SurA
MAEATVVERIVAVVGEKAILLSDLRGRAQPFLIQVHQSVPAGAQRNAAISQLYRTVLDRLVDEELEQRAAQQSKVAVSAQEIDDALARVAAQNKVPVESLVEEAKRSGLTEKGYRDELRRQLLEAKLINVRLQGRIRVTEDDLRLAYRKLVMEERQRQELTPAWIVIAAGATPSEQREQRALADRIAAEARSSDFAALARRHSDDRASRAAGGKLQRMHANELPAQLARVALGLEVGETSPAVRLGDRFVIVKVLERPESELPEYEDARRELAKKVWIDGLRRQHHVEVRL